MRVGRIYIMYRLADRVFRTKQELRVVLSTVLGSHKLGDVLFGADMLLVRAVLEYHPRHDAKIGCGVKSIYIGEGKIPGATCFWIQREDGSRTDFSFLKCLNPPSLWSMVQKAARTAVQDQIAAFRKKVFTQPERVCAITGKTIEKHDCHIDHVYPFELLLANFLHGERRLPNTIDMEGHEDGSTELSFVDKSLAARWAAYHRRHAHLRAVTPKANLTRKKG
jgi:hypothetical protein